MTREREEDDGGPLLLKEALNRARERKDLSLQSAYRKKGKPLGTLSMRKRGSCRGYSRKEGKGIF